MNMVDSPTLLTIIFVLVDDWYQEFGYQFVPAMPGPKYLTTIILGSSEFLVKRISSPVNSGNYGRSNSGNYGR